MVFNFPPSIWHEMMGPDAMILVIWMLSFKQAFSLFSFTLIKRLFSSSSFSAVKVVSSAYLRLLVFLPAILIPACKKFHSAYKLNKLGDNIQPWCTPFPIWNQSVVLCKVLIVASCPAYRFLRGHIRLSGIPIRFKNFPQFVVIYTVKGFSIVNKAEVDFFGIPSFIYDPRMLAIWPLVPLLFLNTACTSGWSQFTYC